MTSDANARRLNIRNILKHLDETSAMSSREIHEILEDRGFDCSKKTIDRDLKKLSTSYGLQSKAGTPERFFAPRDFNFDQELTLDFRSLETLFIALQNLKLTSHDYFNEKVTEAEAVLFRNLPEELSSELDYMRKKYSFDFGLTGKPKSDNTEDIKLIFHALREEKEITCKNHSPYKDPEYNNRTRHLIPLNFVLSANMPYLWAKDFDDIGAPPKKFRLSRLSDVRVGELFDIADFEDDSFNPDHHLGGWGGPDAQIHEIRLVVSERVATFFKEKTIVQGQEVHALPESTVCQVAFKAPLSHELTRLLASFGEGIRHVAPQKLYDDVQAVWKSGLDKVG